MSYRKSINLFIVIVVLFIQIAVPWSALAQEGEGITVVVSSPTSGATVGSIVSILGKVAAPDLEGYSLAFGQHRDTTQWIPIVERSAEGQRRFEGRLGLWNTTGIPDGIYVVRLRATLSDGAYDYVDYYVEKVLVSNAPKTPSPVPTALPTETPTPTAIPTATPTLQPTPDLEDGVSPYLYVTQMDQYDPLCLNWDQRYSIWLSNVGMVTMTNVLVKDVLPFSCSPILERSSPDAQYEEGRELTWQIGEMAPGEVRKLELQVHVPDWLETGVWLANRVEVSSDQVEFVASTERSLLSTCEWRKQTVAPVRMPTAEPSLTVTVGEAGAQPTRGDTPTATPIQFNVSDTSVERSLDLLTVAILVVLGILVVVTVVLVYRQVGRR